VQSFPLLVKKSLRRPRRRWIGRAHVLVEGAAPPLMRGGSHSDHEPATSAKTRSGSVKTWKGTITAALAIGIAITSNQYLPRRWQPAALPFPFLSAPLESSQHNCSLRLSVPAGLWLSLRRQNRNSAYSTTSATSAPPTSVPSAAKNSALSMSVPYVAVSNLVSVWVSDGNVDLLAVHRAVLPVYYSLRCSGLHRACRTFIFLHVLCD